MRLIKKKIKFPAIVLPKALNALGINRTYSNTVRICPVCIELGYHSIFHQSTIFDCCLFHAEEKLLDKEWHYETNFKKSTINYYAQIPLFKVENFVNNKSLVVQIQERTNHLKDIPDDKYCIVNFDWKATEKDILQNTKNFIFNKVFLNKDIYTEDCICSIAIGELNDKSLILIDEICNFTELDIPYMYAERMILEKKLNFKSVVGENLALVIIEYVIRRFITFKCKDISNYYRLCDELSSKYDKMGLMRDKKKAEIYAGIITIHQLFAALNYRYFSVYSRLHLTQIDINLFKNLDKILHYDLLATSKELNFSTPILAYVLIDDLFNYLSDRLTEKIKTDVIDITNPYVIRELPRIIPPQYIIEKTESNYLNIFRISPDNHRDQFMSW